MSGYYSVHVHIFRLEDVNLATNTTSEFCEEVAVARFDEVPVPRIGEMVVMDSARLVTAGNVFRVVYCTDHAEVVIHVDCIQVPWP